MTPDFPLDAGGYAYRPLKLLKVVQRGFDVFALQTALEGAGYNLPQYGPDGYLGKESDSAIRRFQAAALLKQDGIAGIITQRALVIEILRKQSAPYDRLYGQVEHESSFVLGNHTAPYDDGSRDCGVVQRNTNYASKVQGFDVPLAIAALNSKVTAYHSKYRDAGVKDPRAWDLAQGSWNSPVYADRTAKNGGEGPAWFEAYMAAVSTYAYP